MLTTVKAVGISGWRVERGSGKLLVRVLVERMWLLVAWSGASIDSVYCLDLDALNVVYLVDTEVDE